MSRWRRAAQKDVVHAPIVAALKAHGVIVFDMPAPGDVLCYYEPKAMWMPIELKSPNSIRKKRTGDGDRISNNKLKPEVFSLIPVAHTEAEALALFGIRL